MNKKSMIPPDFINRSGKVTLIISLFLFISFATKAQISFTSTELNSEFNRGMDLFNKEKYPAAIRLFDSFIAENNAQDPVLAAEAQYFAAISALKLFNADAEYRMVMYIYNNPESPRLNEGRLELGDYFYQNKNYRKAAKYYETVNRQELEEDKLAEYFFRLGYSSYINGDKDRALLMFSEIKDIDTEYTPPAVYYFSQIAYEKQMYETAMEGFMKLKDDETFGRVVPFYIVQILYLKKDYDGILEMAPELLKSAGKERAVELYRFIGDAYYNKGNYKEALPYLEKYTEGAKASGREDKFQLGYCYYKTGEIDKAIKILLETGAKNDLLSQNIWHILGDCYLQKNDKKKARFAFGEASKLDFSREIKEESLFNYAKLTYETSSSPFGEAIASFQEYINLYPGSERIQQAYNYLVGTYTQLKNYKAALASLDKISSKDARLEEVYQRVAFFRGLELFRDLDFEAATGMFDKSLAYERYNRTFKARAIYWRGEAWYRLGEYERAAADYELFTGVPGSANLQESKLIRYNLASAYFNMQDYSKALAQFRSFEQSSTGIKPDILADAYNRIADCYYIQTDYKMAISYYEKVIDYGFRDADYAMFQKAFCLGLMNDNRGKIEILASLISKYPSSATVPRAIFERGRAYTVLEDHSRGESDFNSVIINYPNSPYVPQAIVQLGLLYYNLGENEKAIAQFKKVIENYKSTPEARYAMTGLKNAYVDNNDVASYFSFIKTLDGYGDINLAQKDSLMYTSGENLYMTSKYDRASEIFKSYLSEFPNGIFRQNAQFYLAEALRSSGNREEALQLYMQVADQPNNEFVEQSLLSASSMLYEQEDYTRALGYYERLEKAATKDENKLIALKGELLAAYQIGDAEKTITAAGKIISSENIPEELMREAIFMNARANYSLNKFDEALRDFKKVAGEVTSEEGAEAKYMVADILYKDGQIAEAERVINEFVNQNSPHQYWTARIFLLLADLSLKKGDTLQARATLQSLRDYYSVDDDGIMDEVRSKLESLNSEK